MAEDATEKDTPDATDETQEKEDVEGHARYQRPDRDISAPKSTEDDKADPGKADPVQHRF